MMRPLEIIGHIEVPDSVMDHRFIREAMACLQMLSTDDEARGRVIGTGNTGECELYGWCEDIPAHADRTGVIYIMGLNDGASVIHVDDQGETLEVTVERGTVARMNDHFTHWTTDTCARVCAFLGSLNTPDDDAAMAAFAESVAALARGDYYLSPRVSRGFRVLLDDECLAWNAADDDRVTVMLRADAEADPEVQVLTCAECDRPATIIDHHFPYEWSGNLCASCK